MKRVFLILAFTGCVTIPHLTDAQLKWATTKWPEMPAAELEHGRALYVTRCGSCHTPPEPAEVMGKDDGDMVREMSDRAKLSPEEQQAVLRFLEVATTARPTGVAHR